MKKAMSNVDVAAIVEELKDRILGGFVGKAYQQSSDKIWLSVQSPAEGRLDLLLEAGKRVHITQSQRPASKTPPQFPTMLRSHLSGGRIVDISQHDFDRLIEIATERSGVRSYLIVELFPKGSMVLLNESRQILSMLRKMLYRGSKMAAGEAYLYHPGQPDPRTISLEELSGWLSSAGQDLVRSLVRGLNMGGTYAEEVCLRAGVDKNKQASDLSDEEVSKVHFALRDVFLDVTLEPHIVLEDGEPMDVLSHPLRIYDGLEKKRFATFSDALDSFFVEKEESEARQNPEWVANTKAYQTAWYAQKKQDPEWLVEQATKLEQKRQDPEWVENKNAREAARYETKKANGTNYYERLKADSKKMAEKRAWEKEWRKNNPERVKEIYKNSDERKKQKDPIKFLLRQTKSHAKSKGIEFNIESIDFVMPDTCPVLGIPITPFASGLAPGTPSFDRTDPRKGYVKGNVKIISNRANRLKCDCTDPAELRAVADYIEQNLASIGR